MEKSADAFRTISEVADDLTLPQHVLRFWETRFSQIRPLKRAGGRRYYRPADVALLKTIRQLLYDDGYTIKGVQRLLKEQGKALVSPAPDAVAGTSIEEETSEMPALPSSEFMQDHLIYDEPTTETPIADEQGSESRVVAIYDPSGVEDTGIQTAGHEELATAHRDALIEAITTIDECLRILAIARRAT